MEGEGEKGKALKAMEVDGSEVEVGEAKEKEAAARTATLGETFMHATSGDYLLMFVGAVAALVNGIGDPLLIVLFSQTLSAMAFSGLNVTDPTNP